MKKRDQKKPMWITLIIILIVATGALIFPFGCTVIGIRSGYEEAGYQLAEKRDGIEIRDYEELVVVETVVDAAYKAAGNQAFRKLFRYISGNNTTKTKIAMTTPVIADEAQGEKVAMTAPVIGEEQESGGWRYQFVLPSTYTLETAPRPKDPSVKLAVIPERKVAVLRYAGTWKEKTMREKTRELQAWIEASEYEAASDPRSAGYDPPWTIPPLRRNEILIDIRLK
jgi:DNA gyrase inhibitor GyrI